MSSFQSLVVGQSYDSYDAVLQVINTVEEKEQIYLRINRPLSISVHSKVPFLSNSKAEIENEAFPSI